MTAKPVSRSFVGGILAVVTIVVFLYLIRVILLPFVIAGIIAYVCTPLVDRIARHGRMPRIAAVSLVFLTLAAIATAIGWLSVPLLLSELKRVYLHLPHIIETLVKHWVGNGTTQFLGQPMNAHQVAQALLTDLRNLLRQSGHLLLLASWGFAGAFAFILSWVLLFYFLAGAHRIGRDLMHLVPPARRGFARHVWGRLHGVLFRYFVGIAVVVIYACIAAYIGLGLILGLHHAVFLALLTGLLEMIPVVGPGTSAVIAGLVAIEHAKGIGGIIAYVIYATALRISIDQILGPMILGQAARIHPTLVIFCFLSGAILFGIPGVILAVPVALTIKVVLATIYNEELPHERDKRLKR
jgi:predicted PurR-regulated permease PerM